MGKLTIAIDGPAGAGKSTVAQRVAQELGYIYIDTGAMYRALTWKALEEQIDIQSNQQVTDLLHSLKIRIVPSEGTQRVYVNETEVTEQIRSREVTNQVSVVASHPDVRGGMLHLQRALAEGEGVVMDGRDIGTHVLPQAEIKIFLSASIEERASRRFLQLKEKGQEQSYEELMEEIRVRDEKDSQREIAPLRKASDAVEIDTTGLNIEKVVGRILNIVNEKDKEGVR